MSKRGSKRVNLYANLSNRHKSNREYKARRRAEYLASLPKHPLKRILYRMHPKRFFAYWLSKDGLFMSLKLFGIGVGVVVLLIGLMVLYYRQEIAALNPDQLAARVQTTVTRYYDRNGILLWEDKGDGTYKLAVKSDQITDNMKKATVAIEDKDFYKHGGFSLSGIVRAGWSNATGSGNTQGGSTLTQQLIKQVFFADQAGDRGISGVPRKIKEVILSVQVENMYSKDQILTMYLNESPYGGRRNGVESAAQTYFGKSAKDLTLAEASLLAAIPQNPTAYNPYNTDGNESLIARQHTVLNYMAEQGLIKKDEAEAAKKVAILDEVKPEADQYKDMKAPHFVQMVKAELQTELGAKVVGDGGLTVKTTLDYRVQQIIEGQINTLFAGSSPRLGNFDNAAATMIDSQTGQILGLVGSRGFSYPGYGAYNVATSWRQPGSTIKPLVYAALFKGNYGPGSILADSPIPQSIYKTDNGQSVSNFDNKFLGGISIRSSLAMSRNIPAIKAMYTAGVQNTLSVIRDMGDKSYCTNGQEVNAGLSASIGGCTTNQVDHVNAFATIARMGVYKPTATVLEVKNAQGQIVEQWKDSSKQVLDPQVTYELADIMSDQAARAPAYGTTGARGFLPGSVVKIGGKTGTSNNGITGKPRDLWFLSYSPKATFGIWVGNHDSKDMSTSAFSTLIGPVNSGAMYDAHTQVFQKDGTWKPNDWYTTPAGLQKLTIAGKTDWYPSWFNKSKATTGEKITFDKVSKKKATDCTPDVAKIEISVQTMIDPVTKQKTYLSTDGYDPNASDDTHQCSDTKPFVNSVDVKKTSSGVYSINVSVTQGSHALQSIAITVGGASVGSITVSSSGIYSLSYTPTSGGSQTVIATATDTALYASTPVSTTYTFE